MTTTKETILEVFNWWLQSKYRYLQVRLGFQWEIFKIIITGICNSPRGGGGVKMGGGKVGSFWNFHNNWHYIFKYYIYLNLSLFLLNWWRIWMVSNQKKSNPVVPLVLIVCMKMAGNIGNFSTTHAKFWRATWLLAYQWRIEGCSLGACEPPAPAQPLTIAINF